MPYRLSALFLTLLTLIPFLAVTVPPSTDLPQQTAQIRLLFEQGGETEGPYRVQWWHPNKLGYVPLALGWAVGGPVHAGRIGLALLAIGWVLAVVAVAHLCGRMPAAAVAAALLVFSHALYWGFLNFLAGFPLFLLWLALLRHPAPPSRDVPRTALLALLLYGAHVLWLAAALFWLVADFALDRGAWRRTLQRLAASFPALLAVALWYPSFTAGGVDPRSFPGRPFWERLDPGWLVGTILGGLRGPLETILLASLALWTLAGFWEHRTELAARSAPRLLAAGTLFLLAGLALPEVHRHTIFFAGRWMPPAVALLILGSPTPRGRWLSWFPWILWIAWMGVTTQTWRDFERHELAGLETSLEAIPADSLVLGLDFVRTSPRILGFPYYHLYAHAQVRRGGELNRSFADEASSLVVYRQLPHSTPWTGGLDWKPRQLRHSDIEYFDAVLLHADDTMHTRFQQDPKLRPFSTTGAWRLYFARDRQP